MASDDASDALQALSLQHGDAGEGGPNYPAMLTTLADAVTKHSGSTTKSDAVTDALDKVLDEVRSGEPGIQQHAPAIAETLLRLYENPNWHYQQLVNFGLMHLCQALTPSQLQPLLTSVLPRVLGNLGNTKREVRDASSQAVAAMAGVAGPPVLQALLDSVAARDPAAASWQWREGVMMCAGYAGRRCAQLSSEHFYALFDMIEVHVNSDKHTAGYDSAYATYVRRQGLRALARLVSAPGAAGYLKERETRLRAVIVALMRDDNIDVRKNAGQVFAAWCGYLHRAERSVMAEAGDMMLNELATAASWEHRHGGVVALAELCRQPDWLGELDSNQLPSTLVQRLLADLGAVVVHTHGISGALGAAATPNAVALQALTVLYVSLYPDASASPQSAQVLQASVLPYLFQSFCSLEPSVLDAAGVALGQLMRRVPLHIKPSLSALLVLDFKNQFHASLPIRDGALKNWRAAVALLADMFTGEAAMLAGLTPDLLNALGGAAAAGNTDVRETVFKAMEAVFAQAQPPLLLSSRGGATQLSALLAEGVMNQAGGSNAEYPRAAAASAMACLLALQAPDASGAAPFQDDRAGLAADFAGTLAPFLTNVLGNADESDIVLVAVLRAAQALVTYWGTDMRAVLPPLAAVVLPLAHSSVEAVRVAALPLAAILLASPPVCCPAADVLQHLPRVSDDTLPEQAAATARSLLALVASQGASSLPMDDFAAHLASGLAACTAEEADDAVVAPLFAALHALLPALPADPPRSVSAALAAALAVCVGAQVAGDADEDELLPDLGGIASDVDEPLAAAMRSLALVKLSLAVSADHALSAPLRGAVAKVLTELAQRQAFVHESAMLLFMRNAGAATLAMPITPPAATDPSSALAALGTQDQAVRLAAARCLLQAVSGVDDASALPLWQVLQAEAASSASQDIGQRLVKCTLVLALGTIRNVALPPAQVAAGIVSAAVSACDDVLDDGDDDDDLDEPASAWRCAWRHSADWSDVLPAAAASASLQLYTGGDATPLLDDIAKDPSSALSSAVLATWAAHHASFDRRVYDAVAAVAPPSPQSISFAAALLSLPSAPKDAALADAWISLLAKVPLNVLATDGVGVRALAALAVIAKTDKAPACWPRAIQLAVDLLHHEDARGRSRLLRVLAQWFFLPHASASVPSLPSPTPKTAKDFNETFVSS